MKHIITSLCILLSSTIHLNAESCAFCKNHFVKTQVVSESQNFIVALSFEPQVPGHLVVIPKRHIVKAHELVDLEWLELSGIVRKVVNVFTEFLGTDEYIIFEKNGPNAFQDVPHVHFHFLPIHSETWAELFDVPSTRLPPRELEKQRVLFKSYFNQGEVLEKKA